MLVINASYMPGRLSRLVGMNKMGFEYINRMRLIKKLDLTEIVFLKKRAVLVTAHVLSTSMVIKLGSKFHFFRNSGTISEDSTHLITLRLGEFRFREYGYAHTPSE